MSPRDMSPDNFRTIENVALMVLDKRRDRPTV